jgi:hypothetical protein
MLWRFMAVTNKRGLDWIYCSLHYNHSDSQLITITHSKSSAEPFYLDYVGLTQFSFWFDSDLYFLYSLEAGSLKTPLPLLLYLQRRCIATDIIRLLPACSLPRECVNGVVANSGSTGQYLTANNILASCGRSRKEISVLSAAILTGVSWFTWVPSCKFWNITLSYVTTTSIPFPVHCSLIHSTLYSSATDRVVKWTVKVNTFVSGICRFCLFTFLVI